MIDLFLDLSKCEVKYVATTHVVHVSPLRVYLLTCCTLVRVLAYTLILLL